MTEEHTIGEWAERRELRADAVVQRVASSGAERNPVAVLTGLLGQGRADGAWLLYLSQHFDEYVEFDAADVVHSESVNEAVPLEGTRVWVKASATLQYTHVSSRQVQANFLRGGITSSHLSQTGAASFGGSARSETGYACTRNYVCSINPHIPMCQDN